MSAPLSRSFSLRPAAFALLALYSLALLVLEFNFGQAFVRPFFTDIEGSVPFYAINTSLSSSLLGGTGLLFGVCLLCLGARTIRRRDALFYASQALFFVYLAVDDRFKGHELVGNLTGVNDAYFLLSLGAAEAVILVLLGGLFTMPRLRRFTLYGASVLFAVMTVVDAFLPSELVLRLSVEDLTKTWACALFFWFGWQTLHAEVSLLRAAALPMGDGAQTLPGSPEIRATAAPATLS